jgi:glutamyl-tRNA(Gln) amidotransferase subunit E
VKAGLEVHQQLATGKLFCACPAELTETVDGAFSRRLRASTGEGGSVDPAATFQASRELLYRYETGPSNCLVEMDEEPPRPIEPAALDTALTLALMLGAQPVSELEVMRKIVVDGSNTSGFQRTALVATGGHLEVGGRTYRIDTICLEEDAARKVGDGKGEVTYRLDRLGIPLIEVATGPEITSGPEARAVAEEIGALLRATQRVRRGIGTIREDLNVSVEGGRRVEIKGVQELKKIHEYMDREAARQGLLLRVRDELRLRHAPPVRAEVEDITAELADIESGPAGGVGQSGRVAMALGLRGFDGLLRSPPGEEERLGRELADYARAAGERGLLHSDELPGHGIDANRVARIRERLGLGSPDAFVIVIDTARDRAVAALAAVARRADAAREGIPGETRDPLPDGRSRYSRPLPGRDRMYPETDVPPVTISEDRIRRLREQLPERPSELRERLGREHSIPAEIARQLVAAGDASLFETLVHRSHPPALAARLLTQDIPGLAAVPGRDETPVFSLDTLDALLTGVETGRFAKEGFPALLSALAAGAPDVGAAVERAGLAGPAGEELDTVVARVVDANQALVREKGDGAFSALMGDVMREVRGRRDGREVAEALHRAIARRASDAPT